MKLYVFFSHLFDAFEIKGFAWIFGNYFLGNLVLGHGLVTGWLLSNNLTADHYIVGAIGQFFFVCLYFFYEKQNGIAYKSNLGYIQRAIWNLTKINAGGIGALFLTKFVSIKFLTIFIGFEIVLAFIIGILSHYFVRFIEKIMKLKEKELDNKIDSTHANENGEPEPGKPKE